MPDRLKGITIEIEGNASPLKKELSSVDSALKATQGELRDVNKLLKLDPGNAELLAQKQKLLTDAIGGTRERLETLRSALTSDLPADQYNALQREIAETEINLRKLETQQAENDKAMQAGAGVVADQGEAYKETSEEIENATEKTSAFADVLKANLTSQAILEGIKKIGDGLKQAGKALAESVKDAAAYADEMLTLSTVTGISTDTLQAFDYMSGLVDVDLSTITGGLKKLTKSMSSAADGTGSTAEAFSSLGVSVTNSDGSLRNSEKVFYDVIDALGQVQNETERDAVAMELFGKSATELNPLIAQGSRGIKEFTKEAKNTGYVLNDETLGALGSTQDAFDRLSKTGEKLKRQLGASLSTTVEKLATALNKISNESDFAEVLDVLGEVGESLLDILPDVLATVKKLGPILKDTLKAVLPALGEITKAALPVISQALETILPPLLQIVKSVLPVISKILKEILPALQPIFKLLDPILKIVLELLKPLLQLINSILPPVISFIKSIADGISSVLGPVLDGLGAGLETISTWISSVIGKGSELTESEAAQKKAIDETKTSVQEQKDAWAELIEKQQENIKNGTAEIEHYESLWDELKNITDENGKIKEGYEERAKFITGELKNAYGVEAEINDGVIQDYQAIQSEIENVIKAKRAQFILDNQQSLYQAALEGQTQAAQNLSDAEDQLRQSKLDLQIANNEYDSAYRSMLAAENETDYAYFKNQLDRLEQTKKNRADDVANAQATYDQSAQTFKDYAAQIGVYETNMALFTAGKYDEMIASNQSYTLSTDQEGKSREELLGEQLRVAENSYNELLRLKENSQSDIYDSQIEAAARELNQIKKQMADMESSTKNGLKAVDLAWSESLDDQLSEITGSNVEFKEAADGTVQMYINGVKEGEPKTKQEMATFVEEVIGELSETETGGRTAGEDLIDGINYGIGNERKQNGVFATISGFASKLLGRLRSGLQEKSPSKATNEMGRYLLEGLSLGIKAEEGSVLNHLKEFGEKALETLNRELQDGATLGEISGSIGNLTGLIQPEKADALYGGLPAGSTNNSTENYINVVVNGAPGQSVNELAEKVAQKIQAGINRQRRVFA